MSPLLDACLKTIYKECGPDKGTVEIYRLELSQGSGYRTLLRKMMYSSYVTCQPDISYAITTMSKLSIKLSKCHYELLNGIAKYLQNTKDQGIKLTQSVVQNDLTPATLKSDVVPDKSLPPFPVDINQRKLMAVVDAAHANQQQKHQSTTIFVFTYCGVAIIYRSKTQSVTAVSSTEAKFIAAVTCEKIALAVSTINFI